MSAIDKNNVIEGSAAELYNAGTPGNGTNAAATLSISGTPTGGTFSFNLDGTVIILPYNASAAAVQAAIVAALGPGTTTGGGALPGTPVTIAFAGTLGLRPLALSVSSAGLTGGSTPTAAVATNTPGVNATHVGAAKGQLCQDTTNGIEYQNQGAAGAPTWVKVSTE